MFGGVKLCFWTIHCAAYRVLTSCPSAASCWVLEGATGCEETEVPDCNRLLPTAGTQLATSTPTETSAYSIKAEEGFSLKNFMLMRQRKLKIDGEDSDGTSVQGTKLRSTNRKEGSCKPTLISLSIRVKKFSQLQRATGPQQSKGNCVAVMKTKFQYKHQPQRHG